MNWPFVTLIKKFLDLWDTPPSYKGHAGGFLRVNLGEDSLEFAEALKDFLGLEDTPDSYAGQEGKIVVVKATEDGLEFTALPPPGAHHESHEDGGADEVSVAGLSGVLGDKQDADKLQGRAINPTAPTDGQVLIWDAATSKWKPGPAVGWVTSAKAGFYLGTNQAISPGAWTKINLDTEDFDPGDNLDLTNHRFIAPVAGYYLICGAIAFGGSLAPEGGFSVAFRKNGARMGAQSVGCSNSKDLPTPSLTKIAHLAANDYVELFTYHDGAANIFAGSTYNKTRMEVHLFSKD